MDSGSASRRRRSQTCCAARVWGRRRGGEARAGVRSCARKQRAWSAAACARRPQTASTATLPRSTDRPALRVEADARCEPTAQPRSPTHPLPRPSHSILAPPRGPGPLQPCHRSHARDQHARRRLATAESASSPAAGAPRLRLPRPRCPPRAARTFGRRSAGALINPARPDRVSLPHRAPTECRRRSAARATLRPVPPPALGAVRPACPDHGARA